MTNCNDCPVFPDYLSDPKLRKDRLCLVCWRWMYQERNKDIRQFINKEIDVWSKRAEAWENDGTNDAILAKNRVATLKEIKHVLGI